MLPRCIQSAPPASQPSPSLCREALLGPLRPYLTLRTEFRSACSKARSSAPPLPRPQTVLTLRPGLGGVGRRAGNLATIGQDGEDGRLQHSQDEHHLQNEGDTADPCPMLLSAHPAACGITGGWDSHLIANVWSLICGQITDFYPICYESCWQEAAPTQPWPPLGEKSKVTGEETVHLVQALTHGQFCDNSLKTALPGA